MHIREKLTATNVHRWFQRQAISGAKWVCLFALLGLRVLSRGPRMRRHRLRMRQRRIRPQRRRLPRIKSPTRIASPAISTRPRRGWSMGKRKRWFSRRTPSPSPSMPSSPVWIAITASRNSSTTAPCRRPIARNATERGCGICHEHPWSEPYDGRVGRGELLGLPRSHDIIAGATTRPRRCSK